MAVNMLLSIILTSIILICIKKYYKINNMLWTIVGTAVFSSVFYHVNSVFFVIYYLVVLGFLFILTIIDMKEFRIPNKILMVFLGIGILLNLFRFFLLQEKEVIINMALGIIIGALPLFLAIIFSKGKMGAGDMKLMAVVGLYTGYVNIFIIFILTIVIAALFAIIMIGLKKWNLSSKIPLAPFIFLSTYIVVIFNSQIFIFLKSVI